MCYCNPWCYITAGILTIIQCFLHWILCIWIILIYTCQYSMLGKSYLLTLWYFTYFYRSQCTNATTASFVTTLTTVIDKDINDLYNFSNNAPSASMVYYIAITYAILDIVWVIAAIFLLVGIFQRSLRYTVRTIQFPWLVCCLMVCLLDVTAVAVFASHISQTDTLHKWITFVGGNTIGNVDVSKYVIVTDIKGRDLVIPSIIMTLLFSRLIFIWCVNVAMFVIFIVLMYVKCTQNDVCTCELQPRGQLQPIVLRFVRDTFVTSKSSYDESDYY